MYIKTHEYNFTMDSNIIIYLVIGNNISWNLNRILPNTITQYSLLNNSFLVSYWKLKIKLRTT